MTWPAFPLTRILIITDAWKPQVNGVVRSIEALVREAPALGVEIEILAADGFRTVPLPTYPQVRVAVTRPSAVRRQIENLKPDFIHIATEGPLGLCAWFACRRAGRSFTTCYHTRFPEYLAARRVAPSRFVYALLRRFHNAGSGMMVSTETLGRELETRGFVRLMRWSRGVDCNLFRPHAASIFEFPRPIFLTCARVAVEKNLDAFLSLDLPGSKVVVGDGPARKKLQTRFPGAHFVGEMRDERLAAAYASADVFVFPSLTDTFGLVLLEALASGLPVAANPVAGPLDVIGDSGAGILDANLGRAALAALSIPKDLARARALTFSVRESTRQFVDNVFAAHRDNVASRGTLSRVHGRRRDDEQICIPPQCWGL
jgi:1,2-diacylglycerol 3-alpha-glucosyltransferase/glucuronosyltransferase